MPSTEGGDTITPNEDSRTEFDFRLPHLNTSGVTDTSNTDEPFLQNFLGNVRFIEWKEFDNLMSNTLASTSGIVSPHRDNAQIHLDCCRRKVNKVFPNSAQNPRAPILPRPPMSDEVCYTTTPLYQNQDPRKHFRTSTSVGVFEDVFSGLIELLEGLWKTAYNFDFSIQQFPLLGNARFVKMRSPIPDRSLCTVTMNLCDVPPICAFELKGPAVAFARYVVKHCEKISDVVMETVCGNRGCGHEVASDGICRYLNHLFEGLQDYQSGTRGDDINKGIARRVSQTLTQALTTSSGCGFLYNYEVGIAFEILKRERGKVVVRTAPLFCCGNQRGAVAAMLTMANYAVDKLTLDKASSGRVMECVNFLTGNLRDSQGTRNEWRQSSSSGPDASEHLPNNSASDQGETRRSSRKNPATESCFSLITRETVRELSEEGSMSDITEDEAINDSESRLNDVLRAQRQIIASGGSGMLVSSYWNGKMVALKMWNGEEEEGFLQLRREVETYKHIQTVAPSLLGTAVPDLVLALDTTSRDGSEGAILALVTDYVGQGLSRDMEGRLWITNGASFQVVGAADIKGIRDAALQSMESLHRAGITHGDVSLRNLRIEADIDSVSSNTSWKAWWIDLGKSSYGSRLHLVNTSGEVECCISLFET